MNREKMQKELSNYFLGTHSSSIEEQLRITNGEFYTGGKLLIKNTASYLRQTKQIVLEGVLPTLATSFGASLLLEGNGPAIMYGLAIAGMSEFTRIIVRDTHTSENIQKQRNKLTIPRSKELDEIIENQVPDSYEAWEQDPDYWKK